MTWKEPLLAKQQRIKQSPNTLLTLVKLSVVIGLTFGPITVISIWLTDLILNHRFVSPFVKTHGWFVLVLMSLYCSGLSLFATFWLCGMGMWLERFPIRYRLDKKGIFVQGSGFRRSVPWKKVVHLEVLPHPTLENIDLIRIETTGPSPLAKNRFLRYWLGIKLEDPIVEMPFEPSQRENIEAAIEAYRQGSK